MCERLESQNRASTQLQADWQAWQSCGQLHCLKIATMKLLMGKLYCAVRVGIELLVCVELLCLVVRTTVTCVCPVGNWNVNCGYEEALHSNGEVLVLPEEGTRLARG